MVVLGTTSATSGIANSFYTVNSRANDGDYKVANANTSSVKDADGDYKPKTASSTSSSGVQSALANLKVGG
jgi:hypothetical protein